MTEKSSVAPGAGTRNRNIPVELLVGLATAPLLVALVGGKALSDAVTSLGQLSEELFRGDRLPLLKVSPSDSPAQAAED